MSQPPPNLPYMPAMSPPVGNFPSGVVPAMTPEQMRELELGRQRAKKVRRAVNVARTDAGITGFFAVMTLSSSALGLLLRISQGKSEMSDSLAGPETIFIALALTFVTVRAFMAARRLAKLDRRAPVALAINQLVLAASIILYAAICLHNGLNSKSSALGDLAGLQNADPKMAGDIDQLYKLFYWGVYGGLIVGTIIFQGLAAWYYASRAKHLDAYLTQTPDWVVEFQRRQGA